MKKKITAIVHDLSSNPIVRAHSILHSLKLIDFDIEVVGLLINEKKIFAPYSKLYNYKTINIGSKPSFLKIFKASLKLYKKCTGDYVYIFKPLPTTCITGLLYSFIKNKKIICCDVEDNEIYINYKSFPKIIRSFWSIKFNYPFHFYFKFKKNITVANEELKKIYKGRVIYHAPILINKTDKYKKINSNLKIFFGGTPRKFKGLNILIDLIKDENFNYCELITAGPDYNKSFSKYKSIQNYSYLGMIENQKIYSVMKEIDIIVVPSEINSFTKFQTPAKLLEAMAYGKIIIASDLPAMRELLMENRGIIINKFNLINLKKIIEKINLNKSYYEQIAINAHKFYLKEMSIQKNAVKLDKIFNSLD